MKRILRQTLLVIFLWNLLGFTSSLFAQIKEQKKAFLTLSLEELSADKLNVDRSGKEQKEISLSGSSFSFLSNLPESFQEKNFSFLTGLLPRTISYKICKKDFLFITSGASPPFSFV